MNSARDELLVLNESDSCHSPKTSRTSGNFRAMNAAEISFLLLLSSMATAPLVASARARRLVATVFWMRLVTTARGTQALDESQHQNDITLKHKLTSSDNASVEMWSSRQQENLTLQPRFSTNT